MDKETIWFICIMVFLIVQLLVLVIYPICELNKAIRKEKNDKKLR